MSVSEPLKTDSDDESQVLVISINNPKALKIFKALASKTRLQILNMINTELYICRIAEKINQTEANASAQVKVLEKVGILAPSYQPGKHGIKKISKKVYKTIIIKFVEE